MKKTFILIFLALITIYISNSNEYVEIPASSIRMRVIASSNSESDQNDKIIVKSIVEEKLYELIDGVQSSSEVNQKIKENKASLDESIKNEISKTGKDITFTSNYGLNYFPEKEFKGLTYKAGNYNSYVLTLGNGEGENWWCVLYPPLCLIDENTNDYEYHSLIYDTLLQYN